MKRKFFELLLKVLIWLAVKVFDVDAAFEDEEFVEFAVSVDGIVITGEINEMELREGQQVKLKAVPLTRSGNAATYEAGSARWSVQQPAEGDVVSIHPDTENELIAIVRGVNGSFNGAAVVRLEIDGDPDQDQERLLIATADVVVTQGEAFVTSLTTEGGVEDIPAEAPPAEEEPTGDPNPGNENPGGGSPDGNPPTSDTEGGSDTGGSPATGSEGDPS